MKKRWAVPPALLFALCCTGAVGCSDEEPGLVLAGDWFFCKSATCQVVQSMGLRFKPDNVWTELSAEGDYLEAAETYCAQPGEFKSGTYKLEGTNLKIKGRSCGSIIADGTIRVEGDVIIFVETARAMKRIDPPRLQGPCQASGPTPDAAPDAGNQGG